MPGYIGKQTQGCCTTFTQISRSSICNAFGYVNTAIAMHSEACTLLVCSAQCERYQLISADLIHTNAIIMILGIKDEARRTSKTLRFCERVFSFWQSTVVVFGKLNEMSTEKTINQSAYFPISNAARKRQIVLNDICLAFAKKTNGTKDNWNLHFT